jgi:hypothetical protein
MLTDNALLLLMLMNYIRKYNFNPYTAYTVAKYYNAVN